MSAPRCRRLRLSRGMPHRRRRVFVETSRGRVSAGFTLPEAADAADVSMALRRQGWSPYRLRLEAEQHAWIAIVIDWTKAARLLSAGPPWRERHRWIERLPYLRPMHGIK